MPPVDAAAPNPATVTATGEASDPAAPTGLTSAAAAERLRLDGPNRIGGSGRRTRLAILVSQLASPLVLILVGASLVSLVVGDAVNASIILAIVVMSAALGFVQEARSESAVAALQARLTLRATVVRDGAPHELPIPEVVRGDLVTLSAGDIVPADGRVIEATHLYVDEASLTGESAPATKTARDGALDPTRDEDRDGLLFVGTSVVSGTGRAVITATGTRTSYGEIAKRLAERAPENDFQRGVRTFGFLIFRVTAILVVAVLAINVGLHRPVLESLLFAIALAVGLTPELLPAIVTLNLTQGAHALAAHGVLVKRLPAIQNLGSITVLATDKTGTLTEGRLAFVRAVGIDGEDKDESAQTLEFAYLNSHFQTGFTNPLDAALLSGTPEPADLGTYRKLAELPYDFSRRLLSVVVQREGEPPLLVTKGAPEAVISRSSQVREDHTARPIEATENARLAKLVDEASTEGFRLVAVGSRTLAAEEVQAPAAGGAAASLDDASRLEHDLVFEGVILFSDPPKAGVGDTIADLRTFANTLKYIRMGTSSNFGNMLSMTGAALLLPFLPMTPGQILLNNLIYDASQTAIPTDTVDPDVGAVPARWDVHAIKRFMLIFGPISSIFDFVTFGLLLLVLGQNEKAFHTGWFIESLFTQILVVLVIRTRRSPFWLSRPSRPLLGAIVAALAAAVIIPLSPLGDVLGFSPLPLAFWLLLVVVVAAYLALVELAKRRFEPRA